jgi:flagellar hook-associated protein 1
MAGLTGVMETAKSTLFNTQIEIQTASNNIANAQNKAYARQTAVQTSNPCIQTRPGWLSNGATVTSIIQTRDRFLEQRLLSAISDESSSDALLSQLQFVQGTQLDDGNSGLSQALGAFWDSWDRLVQEPSGPSQQTAVYEAAKNLADNINAAYAQLNITDSQDLPSQINDTIDRANVLIDQIATYNKQIMNSEQEGMTANSLRDARYAALKDLSGLIPIKFAEGANGSYTITAVDGSGSTLTLVDGATGTPLAYTANIPGGSLGGLLDFKTKLESYMGMLDAFANTLSSSVNTAHGTAVFSGTGAAGITAASSFIGTPATETAAALQVANLRNSIVTFPDGTNCRFNGYLAKIQDEIGTDTQTAQTQLEANHAICGEIDKQQQSVSGVSVDEEMVDIIQYQQVYQAAAKIVQTTADILNKLIDSV